MNKTSSKVKACILESGLLQSGDRVLCALSGGADSVALLLILKELEAELGISVFAAHLNHGIRGEEADRDESFCRELCEALCVPFACERVDALSVARERGNGLEEAARVLRYDFLDRAKARLCCNKIATAHHADDNIETVLLHMLRGCALNGLLGISLVRGELIRPLLTIRKAELEQYLRAKNQSFVHDSTNDSTDCTRNYIRHNILPHIYSINGSADKTLARMCSSLAKDSEYLEAQAKSIPENASRDTLAQLHEAVLSRYIRMLYEKQIGSSAIDGTSTDLIVQAIKGAQTVRYDIQGDTTAYIGAKGVEFVKNGKSGKINEVFALNWGENFILPIGCKILITRDKDSAASFTSIYKTAILLKVKADKITDGDALCVSVRTRKVGDSYIFGKMKRDVRRQLINFKIPVQSRDRLPVLCVGNEIFYVHGLRLADGYESKGENTVYIGVAQI